MDQVEGKMYQNDAKRGQNQGKKRDQNQGKIGYK